MLGSTLPCAASSLPRQPAVGTRGREALGPADARFTIPRLPAKCYEVPCPNRSVTYRHSTHAAPHPPTISSHANQPGCQLERPEIAATPPAVVMTSAANTSMARRMKTFTRRRRAGRNAPRYGAAEQRGRRAQRSPRCGRSTLERFPPSHRTFRLSSSALSPVRLGNWGRDMPPCRGEAPCHLKSNSGWLFPG